MKVYLQFKVMEYGIFVHQTFGEVGEPFCVGWEKGLKLNRTKMVLYIYNIYVLEYFCVER